MDQKESIIQEVARIRSQGLRQPRWFGLGFIQLDLDDRRRLHVWINDWPAIDPDGLQWHDHRYDFTSHVISGMVVNRRALPGPMSAAPFEGCMEMVTVSCQPAKSHKPARLGYCLVHEFLPEKIDAGEVYFMPHDQFHISASAPGTITVLDRAPQVRRDARVIQPLNHPAACPFESGFSNNECWDRIQAALKTIRA